MNPTQPELVHRRKQKVFDYVALCVLFRPLFSVSSVSD